MNDNNRAKAAQAPAATTPATTTPATTTPATTTPATTTPATTTPSAEAAAAEIVTRNLPTLMPPVDVIEDASGITLMADVPGVPRDKLTLRVEADQLCIEGELVVPVPPGMDASYAEVQRSRYRRTFTLSKELDADKIGAELANGVLTLRIPKSAYAQPRRIPIAGA